MSASEDLFQIAQLIDQLRHEDNLLRVNAARSLVKIGRCNLKYLLIGIINYLHILSTSIRPRTDSG